MSCWVSSPTVTASETFHGTTRPAIPTLSILSAPRHDADCRRTHLHGLTHLISRSFICIWARLVPSLATAPGSCRDTPHRLRPIVDSLLILMQLSPLTLSRGRWPARPQRQGCR